MTPEAKLVINKIDELGIEEAAKFFGKSMNQVKTMKRTGNVTLEAYSKLVQQGGAQTQSSVISETWPNGIIPSDFLDPIRVGLDDHERRIQALELARVIPPQTSYVRPQGEVPTPARPTNAPPNVQGLGAIDGIAPSFADSVNQGEKGQPAKPAEHLRLPPGAPGNYNWNKPLAPRRRD